MGSLSAPLDPNFKITVTGLPSGLSISSPSSYPQSSPNNATSGNVDQSVGWVTISGTPTVSPGVYTATLTPYSSIVNYTAATNNSSPPTYTVSGVQAGKSVSVVFTVVPPAAGVPTLPIWALIVFALFLFVSTGRELNRLLKNCSQPR